MDLHNALYHGELAIAEEIIRSGIDVNMRDNFGNTPLSRALYDYHFSIAKLLVEMGANVNSVNSENGNTLLVEAIMDNNIYAVDFLIQHGADVNLKSNNTLPLDYALTLGHAYIVQILTTNGANRNRMSGQRRIREEAD